MKCAQGRTWTSPEWRAGTHPKYECVAHFLRIIIKYGSTHFTRRDVGNQQNEYTCSSAKLAFPNSPLPLHCQRGCQEVQFEAVDILFIFFMAFFPAVKPLPTGKSRNLFFQKTSFHQVWNFASQWLSKILRWILVSKDSMPSCCFWLQTLFLTYILRETNIFLPQTKHFFVITS